MVGFEYLSECAAWSYLFANGTPSAEGMTVSSVCEQGCDNKTRLAAEPADTPDVGEYASTRLGGVASASDAVGNKSQALQCGRGRAVLITETKTAPVAVVWRGTA
jgi:hypothetical protein